MTGSTSWLITDLFRFSIYSWFNLDILCVSRNVIISFTLCKFVGIEFFIVVFYSSVYFCSISCNISPFISNFNCLSHLSFFLVSKTFVNFFYLFKEPPFSFIDFFGLFFWFLLYLFLLWFFIISFLLLTLGLICSFFLSYLRCKPR